MATLKVNGTTTDTKNITLAGGASQAVSFDVTQDKAGSYTIEVAGLSGSFTVKQANNLLWWFIGGTAVLVVAVLLVVILVGRRHS